jgi:hypothetical protein
MGAIEEGGKAVGNVVDAMRSQPLAIALVLMNLGLLVYLYYYTSRITSRTENTAAALFDANNKLYAQFGTIVKDTNALAEKTIHCILPEDAVRLLQARPPPVEAPARPQAPSPLNPQPQSFPPRWLPLGSDDVEWPGSIPLPSPRPSEAPTTGEVLPAPK